MTTGDSKDELSDLAWTDAPEQLLWPQEQQLVHAARQGRTCDFRSGEYDVDDPANAANWPGERSVRAEVIRVLALRLRDDWPVHNHGVQLTGARILGPLDLKRSHDALALELFFCRFDDVPDFMYATIAGLELTGSHLPGMAADRVKVAGSVLLNQEFTATGKVRLIGASIGGQLNCGGGRFVYDHETDSVLTADRMSVTGSVLLNKGFLATGKERMVGASIGGQLLLSGSNFKDAELSLDTATIPGGLFVKALVQPPRRMVLTDARTGSVVDDRASWPSAPELLLEGFVYDGFVGEDTPTDVQWRLEWINRHPSFRPSVFSQLAAVYRQRGDLASARLVNVAKERRRTSILPNWRKPLHWVWGLLAGYGYRPWLSLIYLFALVVISATWLFKEDVMQPVDQVHRAYQSWVYSIDVSIPFIGFGVADDWLPDASRLWLLYLTTGLGWFLSGAFIAAITGIFKPQD